MSGNWTIDVLIALIGAVGLALSGWFTFMGAKVGSNPSPEKRAAHGAPVFQESPMKDFIAGEHDETRRQMQDGFREVRAQHERTLLEVVRGLNR